MAGAPPGRGVRGAVPTALAVQCNDCIPLKTSHAILKQGFACKNVFLLYCSPEKECKINA